MGYMVSGYNPYQIAEVLEWISVASTRTSNESKREWVVNKRVIYSFTFGPTLILNNLPNHTLLIRASIEMPVFYK